ncbi:hypothetical protein P8452_66840 [Trifolium repens]|nr:hypothetical protein P8452_66840 [Trifolium repens]
MSCLVALYSPIHECLICSSRSISIYHLQTIIHNIMQALTINGRVGGFPSNINPNVNKQYSMTTPQPEERNSIYQGTDLHKWCI